MSNRIEIDSSTDTAFIDALEKAPIGVQVIGKMPFDRTKAIMRIRQQMYKKGKRLRSKKNGNKLFLWCEKMPRSMNTLTKQTRMNTDNTVELIGYYGSDTVHAQSAWTSTIREMDNEKEKRIPDLLSMLAKEGHHTPFEKSSFHFLVKTDIATHIHLLKHRVGVSVNAESARYKEIKEDSFLLPEDWVELAENDVIVRFYLNKLEKLSKITNTIYHDCIRELRHSIGRKRAKETARYFKMYNSQITSDVMFNWRSFAHFYKLRSSDNAQKEVALLANQMLSLIKNIEGNPFEHTISAFEL